MYKCVYCGNEIKPEEETSKYKGRIVHSNCLNAVIKETSNTKKKTQAKKAVSRSKVQTPIIIKETQARKTDEEINAQNEFTNYIRKLTHADPKVEHYALAKKYMQDYKITYHEITLGLQFWFEVLHHPFDEDKNFVGIIPYVIEQALYYYKKEKEAIEKNQVIDITSFYKSKPIYVPKPKPYQYKEIDIATIVQ